MKISISIILTIVAISLSSCCTSNIHEILKEKLRLHPDIASNYHFIDTVLKHPAVLYKMRYDTIITRNEGLMSYKSTKEIDKLTYMIEQFSKECIYIHKDTLTYKYLYYSPIRDKNDMHDIYIVANNKQFNFFFIKEHGLWKAANIQIYQYPMRTMGEMLHGKHPDMKP